MQVWPAIDLRGGNCVRLEQGDYERETVFADDPPRVARQWVDQGAQGLHLVDLDGARGGQLVNLQCVRQIVAAVDVPCQLGGGVRDDHSLDTLLDAGLTRVIIGTLAVREPEWFERAAHRYPGRLIMGVDARDGRVATRGWLDTESMEATQLARRYAHLPLAAIVYTDIAKDGMLSGPNLAAMKAMKDSVDLPVIASGGISCADDVRQLAAAGMDGCIIGRAIYEGRLTLAQANQAAKESVHR